MVLVGGNEAPNNCIGSHIADKPATTVKSLVKKASTMQLTRKTGVAATAGAAAGLLRRRLRILLPQKPLPFWPSWATCPTFRLGSIAARKSSSRSWMSTIYLFSAWDAPDTVTARGGR